MIGPELRDFEPPPQAIHDREHLLMHLTCTAVPTCQHFGIPLKFPIISQLTNSAMWTIFANGWIDAI